MSLPGPMAAAAIAAGVLGTPGPAHATPVSFGERFPGPIDETAEPSRSWPIGSGRAARVRRGPERVLAPVAGIRPDAGGNWAGSAGGEHVGWRDAGVPGDGIDAGQYSSAGGDSPVAPTGFPAAGPSTPFGPFGPTLSGGASGVSASGLAMSGISRAEIGRDATPGAAAGSEPPDANGSRDEAGAADLDRLADEVYGILRWRLAGERERLVG
jgi:hypothetical protein